MYNTIVIHYSEIGTKGGNRAYFEKKLMENVKKALRLKTYKRYGRIICDLKKNYDLNKIKKTLKILPGIAYFSFATKTKLNMNQIKKVSLDILKNERFKTFKVKSSRSNKRFTLTSLEIDKNLGSFISKKLKKRVDVKKPRIMLYVEICEKEAFVYCKKHKSIGGLPITTSGKIISSLSGGIDSPVASFLMMKRGCKVVFVHFYNKKAKPTKIEKIVKQLTKIQLSSKLYIIPFDEIQNEIIKSIPSKFRMIIYRRFMIRIINKIAKNEKAKAITAGDSIGQVASQTTKNLRCIYQASELPLFAPLIGMNKQEIIDIAKNIGTYKYSILPYQDCCSYMIAQHPETESEIKKIIQLEKSIKSQDKLIKNAIRNAKVQRF